jgi:Flp pilus assembly protein TadD
MEGRKSEALASYERSFAIREAFSRDYPANTNARRDLAIAHEKLGDLMVAAGDRRGGLERFEQALRIFESLQTLDPFNANAAHAVGVEYEKIADTTGDRAYYAKAVRVFERLAAGDPTNVRAQEEWRRVAGHAGGKE